GRGGFGAVYRAVQQPVGRDVAVKVILPERGISGAHNMTARFFREAKALARLKCRNAVTLYDFGEESDGLLFMVQEFVDGRTLRSLMKSENRPLGLERAVDLASQVLNALEEAHHLDIIHRDITPSNIMIAVDAQGRELVKVLDFGLAKLVDPGGDEETLTRSGIAMGTPHYMAPEAILQRTIDPRTDLYAVGIVLYVMLMGRPPFRGKVAYEVLKQQVRAIPPPMVGVPEPLEDVVRQALAKDPERRFPDAATMREALNEALSRCDLTFEPVDGHRGGVLADTDDPSSIESSGLPPAEVTAAASPRALRPGAAPPTQANEREESGVDFNDLPERNEPLSAQPTREYTPLVDELLEDSDLLESYEASIAEERAQYAPPPGASAVAHELSDPIITPSMTPVKRSSGPAIIAALLVIAGAAAAAHFLGLIYCGAPCSAARTRRPFTCAPPARPTPRGCCGSSASWPSTSASPTRWKRPSSHWQRSSRPIGRLLSVCWPTSTARRPVLPCSSTITPPGGVGPACTSKTCLSRRRCAASAWVGRCCAAWARSRSSAGAGAWSGRCSTGTRRPMRSTARSARSRWTAGRSGA
ncbi:MAG: serine/threonine protein kinase, partial [Myxococcales bacterium]|nr:serine/threonine protein kinase [Myxococcales bacterium]